MYADAGLFLSPVLYVERLPSAAAAARFLGPEDSITKGQELLELPNLTWLRVDLAVLRRAADLYRSVPMRPRDAIHAAAALEAGEREILSEDRVFDGVSGLVRVWPPP